MSSSSEGPRSKEQVQVPAPELAGRLAEEYTDTADGAIRDSIRDSIHDSVHDSVHDSILDSVTEPTQEDHQDLGDQQPLGTEDVSSVSSAVAEEENKHEDEVQTSTCEETAIWRPAWLQPSILASFAGLFLAFGIILPISLCLSKSNYGLFETRQGLGYLWRFGPIAGKKILLVAFLSHLEQHSLTFSGISSYGCLCLMGESRSSDVEICALDRREEWSKL